MSKSSKAPHLLELGGEPRVDLLPPEVHQQEKARATRRSFSLLVVLALLVVGGGIFAGDWRSAHAQADLEAVQRQTETLQAEALKYSDATVIANMVATVTSARGVGASTEILWKDLMDEIGGYLPPGATIVSATMRGRAPWEAELVLGGPLRSPRVATVELVVMSGNAADGTALIRHLSALPGVADATVGSVTQANGTIVTSITLNLNRKALSQRFATTESAVSP